MSDTQLPVDRQALSISDFWVWWRTEGADGVAEAISTGEYGNLAAVITAKVQAIEPELQWELGKGDASANYLCLSAAGIAEIRPATERWLRAAPAADGVWEYRAARRPAPNWTNSRLEIDGRVFSPTDAKVSFTVDADSYRVDVIFFHPHFDTLGPEARERLTFLVLDWVLGEDDVIRWLGEIHHTHELPAEAVPVGALHEVVRRLAVQVKPDRWVMLQGATPTGAPVLATTRRPLWWIDHPTLDQHHIIAIPYQARREDGLPTPEALSELQALEDQLVAWVEPQAMLLAHETGEGRRLVHLYSDSADQNIADHINAWVTRTPRATQASRYDPAWQDMAAYT
ncbi:DUF695 domain-containing protein [Nakamurella silvestris]|nr:DUF695 domain-containing protein [Nakamurella silvestris]